MSGKPIELDRWLTYAVRAGQPGGKGWVRLSPRGVQEGQEVDPAQPPVPDLQSGRSGRSPSTASLSVTRTCATVHKGRWPASVSSSIAAWHGQQVSANEG